MTRSETEALVLLSASLARRDPATLARSMEKALELADPGRAEEVILQSYLFLGYPIALNAFGAWREISGRPAGSGIPDAWEDWVSRGREVCKNVYGGQYERLRRNVRGLHPDMERWMVVEGYGKVLGRPELPLPVRELCIAALLAVLGAPRQLHSHLRGALNTGATVEDVDQALAVARTMASREDWAEATAVWDEVRERWVRGEKRAGEGTEHSTGA